MSAARRPRPRLVEGDVVYNVALGSNMDRSKLCARGKIEPLCEGVACRIEGWGLSFDYIVLPPIEPVMAGAVERPGGLLHGVLWKLTRSDYQALAESEACFWEHPIYEEREVLAVPYGVGSENAEPVRAIVFALRLPDVVPAHLYPSARYKGMMVAGARGAGLAPEFIDSLDKMETAPRVSRAVRGVTLLAATALFYCWKSRYLAPLVRGYYTPLLGRIYSARETNSRHGRHILAGLITAGMVAAMAPVAVLGLIRYIYLGRDIRRIVSAT